MTKSEILVLVNGTLIARLWRYPSQVERTCAAWEERMAFDSLGRPTPMEFVVLDGVIA